MKVLNIFPVRAYRTVRYHRKNMYFTARYRNIIEGTREIIEIYRVLVKVAVEML